jgi:hypothetical protein
MLTEQRILTKRTVIPSRKIHHKRSDATFYVEDEARVQGKGDHIDAKHVTANSKSSRVPRQRQGLQTPFLTYNEVFPSNSMLFIHPESPCSGHTKVLSQPRKSEPSRVISRLNSLLLGASKIGGLCDYSPQAVYSSCTLISDRGSTYHFKSKFPRNLGHAIEGSFQI